MDAKNIKNIQDLSSNIVVQALLKIAYGCQVLIVETQTKDDDGMPLSVKTISLQPKPGPGVPEPKGPMAPGTGSVN